MGAGEGKEAKEFNTLSALEQKIIFFKATLTTKKIKFSSHIGKFRVDLLQSHI